MWDGTTWHPIGPSAAAGPVPTTTIMFSMTCTVNRALPAASAWGAIPFTDLPDTDPMQAWDGTQHKWMPNKAGIYEFQIRGISLSGAGIALLKNDPGTFTNAPLSSDIIVGIQSVATAGWHSSSGLALMNGSTDYVRMWAFSADALFHATGSNPCFTAALLP